MVLSHIVGSSRLYSIFKGQNIQESYHCNYGLNPEWKTRLEAKDLRFTAFDTENQVRAFEITTHPFFIGTLYQPERSALRKEQHPLINAFVKAVVDGKNVHLCYFIVAFYF